MNKTEISTDGVCVYVHSTIDSGKAFKKFVRIAFGFILADILLLYLFKSEPTIFYIGFILLLSGVMVILPMLHTILWSLYGEEQLTFSTKSISQELRFGIFNLPCKLFVFDERIKIEFDVIKDEREVKQGVIHFFGYDKFNQPYQLLQTRAYITFEKSKELIAELEYIFNLEKGINFEYSAN